MQPGDDLHAAQPFERGVERDAPRAILRFRQTAGGSGVSRTGHIRPNGYITVEYESTRLPPAAGAPEGGITGHVEFHPGGERISERITELRAGSSRDDNQRHRSFEVQVPPDATGVELWFESAGPAGPSDWDSREGRNYSFAIIDEGLPVPAASVEARFGAVVDAETIQVVEDAATKAQSSPGMSGRRLHTGLIIRALVVDSPESRDVWADIHVFDATEELIQTSTVTLQPRESGSRSGLFVWEDDVYQGSGGGSGIGVWTRPNAQTVQYRIYCQAQPTDSGAQGILFTDGILHEFEVPPDEDIGTVR